MSPMEWALFQGKEYRTDQHRPHSCPHEAYILLNRRKNIIYTYTHIMWVRGKKLTNFMFVYMHMHMYSGTKC